VPTQLTFGNRPHRRTGRLRRGLDATLADVADTPPALAALARVTADLLDGLAARSLAATDRGQDPPYGITTAIPKLVERYADVLAVVIGEGGSDADPFADLERELRAAMGDAPGPLA
jgi:hypothetical protein